MQSLVSAVFFVALAASTDQLTVPSRPGFYGAVLWLVLLATGGGWGLYLVNLKLSGATRISSLLYLVPPTTMVFAFLLFHETIGPLAVIGMLVCAIAVLLIRLDERAGPVLATLRGWRNPGGWTRTNRWPGARG
ncbi:EamA family transporter [Kribbella turkmenica]